MIALFCFLINRLPEALTAHNAALNIILYAIIETITALLMSLLLMSHLYDRKNANIKPISNKTIAIIGLGNFTIWIIIAAISVSAIFAKYTHVEMPINQNDITAMTRFPNGTEPATYNLAIKEHTYEHVPERIDLENNSNENIVYVSAWIPSNINKDRFSEILDTWENTNALNNSLSVASSQTNPLNNI